MRSTLPILLIAFGGFLFGGAWSLRQQRRPWWVVAVIAVLALMFVAAGLLYL
jgi:hypothetical protein